jgi:hypothetical protein
MQAILALIASHGTRIIALALGTLTTLVATGIIPDQYAEYCMAAIAVLTYWRGQSTSNSYDKGVIAGAGYVSSTPFPPTIVLKASQTEPIGPQK